MTHPEAIGWLYGTQLFGIKLGLDNMRQLAAALDVDLENPPFDVVHVAGTNGKGSTCALADSVARHAGVRTGLFTSPHLVRLNERFRVDGDDINDGNLTTLLNHARTAAESLEHHPTFFEIVTAAALRHFADTDVELALLETGMGGRLDATNTVRPTVSVITPVGLDHQQWLGDTLAAIATEKAGIIKPGAPVLTAPQHPDVLAVLQAAARDAGTPLTVVDDTLPCALPGHHQQQNAALAVAALLAAGVDLDPAAVEQGLANPCWPGRFQQVVARITVDGAHNPPAAAALAATWQDTHPGTPATVVFGAVSTKDTDAVLGALAPAAARFVFTAPDSPRAVDPATLNAPGGLPAIVAHELPAALDAALAHPEPVLVTGSLYLVGSVLDHLAGTGKFQPSHQ